MFQTNQTNVYPFNNAPAYGLQTQAGGVKSTSSKTYYITATVLGVIFILGLLTIVIAIPITYNLNASKTTESSSTTTLTTTISLQWNSTGTTVAGSSAGSSGVSASQLNIAYSLTLDSSNALYITDYSNHRIQKWIIGSSSGTTVAGQASGTSGAGTTALNNPVGIVVDSSGNLYFTDRSNHRLMYWASGASSGTVIAGTGTSGSANNQFSSPSGLVRESSTGTIYVADTSNHRIMRYLSGASSGTVVAGGNGQGTGNTQLSSPYGFILDSSSNSLIIVNYGGHSVVRWVLGSTSWTLLAGSVSGTSGSSSTLLNRPLSVVLDPMGNMYVSDTSNHRIQLFLSGQTNGTTIAGTGSLGNSATQLNTPYWAILDSQLNLYVADTFNNRIQKFSHY